MSDLLSDEYCEGWCEESGGKGKFKDCTGCAIHGLEAQNAALKMPSEDKTYCLKHYRQTFPNKGCDLCELEAENAKLRGEKEAALITKPTRDYYASLEAQNAELKEEIETLKALQEMDE